MAEKLSFIHNATPEFIENLYHSYKQDASSVSDEWQRFFEGFELGASSSNGHAAPVVASGSGMGKKEINVLNLINAYRTRGHLFTLTNPVRTRRQYEPKLDVENFGLSESDLDTVFEAGSSVGLGPAKLRDIIDLLQVTYCRAIGAEYMYLSNPVSVEWLQTRMEQSWNIPKFDSAKKRHILQKLNEAVTFEKFLGTKYVGQKRFSLEGGETLIPALDAIIEKGGALGIEEFIIGMAHRGRLNVLANILKKEYDVIFSEFEGVGHESSTFQGDVKYHMGMSSDVETDNGEKIHLSLMPNLSLIHI